MSPLTLYAFIIKNIISLSFKTSIKLANNLGIHTVNLTSNLGIYIVNLTSNLGMCIVNLASNLGTYIVNLANSLGMYTINSGQYLGLRNVYNYTYKFKYNCKQDTDELTRNQSWLVVLWQNMQQLYLFSFFWPSMPVLSSFAS